MREVLSDVRQISRTPGRRGGRRGGRKSLLRAGARVRVIAPEFSETIAAWSEQHKLTWQAKKFPVGDLAGAFLVVAATGAPGVQSSGLPGSRWAGHSLQRRRRRRALSFL